MSVQRLAKEEMDPLLLRDKFIGSMLGTHVGDALGMPVEGYSWETIEEEFGELRNMLDARLGAGTYTDDTEMMIAVAESLVECGRFDGEDMARRFVNSYRPDRGYGRGTVQVFFLLKSGVPWQEAAKCVFGGGSFGNGASMRIAPVGALYHNNPGELRRVAYGSSEITHAHVLGMEGAALQAKAISMAMNLHPQERLDVRQFLKELIEFISPEAGTYRSKLQTMEGLLDTSPTKGEVVKALGHDSTAPNSVPTAIYSFLSHSSDFEEAVVYAVGLGGDTDTIGAMTGAISGAYHGKGGIPSRWLDSIENEEKGRDYIEKLAVELWKMSKGGKTS